MSMLIAPHGGTLRECLRTPEEAAAVKQAAQEIPSSQSWDLTPRQICDLELLLCGGFSPLSGFMGRADYDGVVQTMRLADGLLWPIPIVLDVTESFAQGIAAGGRIALRDPEGVLLAVLNVSDIWTPDRVHEAKMVYGTDDAFHPGVDFILNKTHPVYVGGRLDGVQMPQHYDFRRLRDTPRQLRDQFQKLGWNRIVAFQTRNPMHRAHQELTFRAARQVEANLLIHPVVGMTRPGDIDHYSRVRCYEHLLKQYPEQTTTLSLLPIAMRMAGPREAVWHALIRKNYGCTHFIVGRDHAGPGKDRNGRDFYGPYDAQVLVAKYQADLGIEMVPFQEMVYVAERVGYAPIDEVAPGETVLNISGTEVRRRLREGLEIDDWFSYPEVVAELRKRHPPKHLQGLALFFTELSGAGKSTIANALMIKLLEIGNRSVTLLDGDLFGKYLSDELGVPREQRDINILRIGYIASEIAKHGGMAICAPIAPDQATRRRVREMVSEVGGFIEIYISTALDVCESRDRKGLYAKARAGLIPQFTGISDPYEVPQSPEITIDTAICSPDEAAQQILLKMEGMGYLR